MAAEVELDRAWAGSWSSLAEKFGISDGDLVAYVKDAAILALSMALGGVSLRVAFESPMGMMLRRRFIKGLAIHGKPLIARAKLETKAAHRAFANAEVHREMISQIGSASGSWFDPAIAEIAAPGPLARHVPTSYLLCVLESMSRAIAEQERQFKELHLTEVEVAERASGQRVG